ncbi:sulfite oxidase-like oxidoreductase [Candidatus Methanoperedens nitroreducens]|uniref:Sulfite oxidase-like oxidoreductase n=1 Tax=Candidatus Methanoperedens nitratireducens TaxID=1392998 RepID=A0A062V8S5_9EURY|nr:molybdopterin-dependent oxidoreductase [Candidatus Methanoperedens nitroreducens]KCZ73702.1 sulfite oxidase-like oxidoreductase [Candidatus Methanoperedens nitroreducens]MDJ1422339.1 molybdopterin-dependent oxidoreductase [Candidatus Methanoperedens sp.]
MKEREPKFALKIKLINRRKFLIWLGIFLGIILAGINMLKQKGMRIINRIRIRNIRNIKRTPSFDRDTWKLTVDGLVNTPLAISYNGFLELESKEQSTDSHCAEGWRDIRWRGVRLKILFDMAGIKPDAGFVTFYSANGIYSDSLPIQEVLGPCVMLAYMLNDELLPEEQGIPLRLVMPGLFGYKNIKCVNRITLA